MIILNERDYAEKMIKDTDLGSKPFLTLTYIAKYYLDQGFSKTETRKKLDHFILQCDPSVSLVKMDNMLDNAVKKALKHDAVMIDYIPITKPELATIEKLKGKMIKRLAFTLLCIAKYWHIAKGNDYWTCNEDNEIMSMANIKTSIKKQDELYRSLRDAGLITFSRKVNNTNVQVNFVQDGEIALKITDFRNLGYQYMKYNGGDFYECQNCGLICKLNKSKQGGRPPKYCGDCAHEVQIQQIVNSVMNMRTTMKKICEQ